MNKKIPTRKIIYNHHERKQRINDLSHFLDENLDNGNSLDIVLEKLDNEISEELVYDSDTRNLQTNQ